MIDTPTGHFVGFLTTMKANASVTHYLVLVIGVIGAASSVFFIKGSHLQPASLSAVRLLASSVILSPLAWFQIRRAGLFPSRRGLIVGLMIALPAALPLAAHYLSWFWGVRRTSAGLSTLLVNLTPVFMPFLVWGLLRERINRGEIIGSLIAIAGVVVLTLGKDSSSGQNTLAGVLVCIGSIGLCSLYLALGRKYARGRSLFAYIVPLYLIAGIVSLLAAIALHESLPPLTLSELAYDVGAVIFPTVIGHTALNYAMVHLPSQVVSCSSLGQFVVVAILAIPIYGEYPGLNLILPAVLVLGGSLLVIRAATPNVQKTIDVAAIEPAGT